MAWRVRAASVVGSGHLSRGRGCDDANAVEELPDGRLAIAVADGAGSALAADIGADLAVDAAMACLRGGGNAAAAMVAARLTLEAAPGPIADLATTLLVAVAGGGRIETAQVGDGAVVVRLGGGDLRVLAPDTKGEYLNETTFLTSSGWAGAVRLDRLPDCEVDAIAVLSDGLQLLAFDLASGTAHEPFFAPLFGFAASDQADDAELAEFLASERVCARTDDDKTLVLAVRG